MTGSSRAQDRPLTITRRTESASRSKDDGTNVRYYVFDEFEVHDDELRPGSVQEWHHHERIAEVLYVVTGTLEIRWVDDGRPRSDLAHEGDAINVGTSSHTVANPTDEITRFVVFRMVPDGVDKRDLIREDKVVDDAPTADPRDR
jgi:uncharacterized cupin superfamily protein